MYQLKKIESYEVTRSLFLESTLTRKIYKVFDDSDILGNNQFEFMKVGKTYNCKIGILGEMDNRGIDFIIISKEQVGGMKLLKLKRNNGDIFYISEKIQREVGEKIKVVINRYDLLEVDGIINDRENIE